MAGIETFTNGQTVRLVGLGTPNQRHCLWVVDFSDAMEQKDWGDDYVKVCRQTDPDCIIWAPRKRITAASVLDLLIAP